MSLIAETIEMLERTDKPVTQIATEAGVSVRWIHLLKRGQIDPAYSRLVRFHAYLKESKTAQGVA